MAKTHRMTPKRRAALRKAQLASARKRRKPGSKASIRVRNRRRKIIKGVGYAAAAATAAGGLAYTWHKRDKLIVAPTSVAVAKGVTKLKGGSKTDIHRAGKHERIQHAARSTFRTREYLVAQRGYTAHEAMRRRGERSMRYSTFAGGYVWDAYVKGRRTRAEHRLRRIKGQKVKGYSRRSGNVKAVIGGRVRKLPF